MRGSKPLEGTHGTQEKLQAWPYCLQSAEFRGGGDFRMSQLLSSLSTAEKEAPQAALGNLRSHTRRRLSSGAHVLHHEPGMGGRMRAAPIAKGHTALTTCITIRG